jgi:hypothetical protein
MNVFIGAKPLLQVFGLPYIEDRAGPVSKNIDPRPGRGGPDDFRERGLPQGVVPGKEPELFVG